MNWTFHDIAALDEMAGEWDAINRSGSNLPILDASFFRMLFTVATPKERTLALCRRDDRPVAAAILVQSGFGSWNTFQPSQAPLGAWVQEAGTPLGELTSSLAKALPGATQILSVTQLDPAIVPRPEPDALLTTMDHIETARLNLEGTFEEYWEGRGKNLKKNVKRQRNRLAREAVETSFELRRDVDAVGAAVDDYGILESQGWKAEQGTALHPDNPQGKFYRELLESCASRGEGFVCRYLYNDSLVASDLYLERGRELVLLKTTHDESQKTTSPSYLLREESVKRFFDDQSHDRIEFYGRVMEWHTKWTDDFRTLYHANQFGSRVAAKAADLKRRIFS